MPEIKRNDNKLNNIIKDLLSGDNQKILVAIKQLRISGKPEAIHPILDVYIENNDAEIKQEISSLLFDLKLEKAIDELIKAISSKKYSEIKPFIISIFWQSGLDVSNHIDFLIKQAIKNDYLVCLEVLTVIENFDATFNEEEINDLILDLEEAIEEDETEKQNLLLSLKAVLQQLNVEF